LTAGKKINGEKIMTTDYIGKPQSRIDGKLKVTGAAKYAAEFNVPDLLYGYIV
jgi:xanthine dehydrogenase YagR molybdenum-binding subunit